MIDIMPIIIGFVSKAPWIMTALAAIGFLRVINKPLFALFHAWAENTETKVDDEILAAAEKSPIYKGFLFVLDWVSSIKIK